MKNERRFELILEQFTMEEVLEEFNISPTDVLELLFDEGWLDEQLLKNLTPVEIES